jgi:hypothetical protein
MDAFTDNFIGDSKQIKQLGCDDPWPDPARKWPSKGQGTKSIVDDYVTFVQVLLTVAIDPVTTPTGPNPTLATTIVNYLNSQHWPKEPGPPPGYEKEAGTVTLVEVAVIGDRLLQAINSFDVTGTGSSGSGSNWPPH